MKRKMRKFSEGGETYDKEDEGILGGKVKYREDSEGRKYTAGKANPMDRNPSEQRYYSMDDVKGKLSGLFGGKKEETYIDKQLKRAKEMPDVEEKPTGIASGFKSSEPKFERNDNEKSMPDVKKAAPRKAAPKEKDAEYVRKAANDSLKEAAPAPKKAKAEEEKKPAPSPAKAADKKPLGKEEKKGFSLSMGKTDEEREAQAKANREALSESVSGLSKYFRNPFTEKKEEKKEKPFVRKLNSKPTADQMKKMAKGGMARSSASKRADGCAIRGKTRA
jgi:hypothetical protein